jgi:peptidoglycan/xylan/chitin deacetylase (PgdA/CDA1 family)
MGARAGEGKPRASFWRVEHGLASAAVSAPARLTAPGGVLSLTFDDFPRSAWTVGGPVLAAHGVRATFYVCGGHEGGWFEGQEQFRAADLEACAAAGHEIGCHGFNHAAAAHAPTADFEQVIEANRLYLRDRIGVEAVHFAYPYGFVSFGAKALARERFVTARGVRNGVNRAKVDRALIRAEGLEARKLARRPIAPLLEDVAARGGWLVLYSHDVSASPSPFGCTPSDLHQVLNLADRLGLAVETMSAAARRVGLRSLTGPIAADQRAPGAQQHGDIGAQRPAF